MKQTAVDILFFEIKRNNIGNNQYLINKEDLEKLELQAKEMEKYQIIDAFEEGISDEASQQNTTPQQYYHKKYGGNK